MILSLYILRKITKTKTFYIEKVDRISNNPNNRSYQMKIMGLRSRTKKFMNLFPKKRRKKKFLQKNSKKKFLALKVKKKAMNKSNKLTYSKSMTKKMI